MQRDYRVFPAYGQVCVCTYLDHGRAAAGRDVTAGDVGRRAVTDI